MKSIDTGRLLGLKLQEVLNLPKNTARFELHVGVDEIVKVVCEYYPEFDCDELTSAISGLKPEYK